MNAGREMQCDNMKMHKKHVACEICLSFYLWTKYFTLKTWYSKIIWLIDWLRGKRKCAHLTVNYVSLKMNSPVLEIFMQIIYEINDIF
jgi:hypothetical protein